MPVVTTLHTVLQDPTPDQRRVLEEVADLSDRLVVMSERGEEFLHASGAGKPPTWPRWRSRWSQSTRVAMASTIGTARGSTQAS